MNRPPFYKNHDANGSRREDRGKKKSLLPGRAVIFCLLLVLHIGVDAKSPGRYQVDAAGELIEQVNALRIAGGLPAYRINAILMVIAQDQADFIARTGIITHYGEEGSRPYQRAVSAGYAVAGDLTFGGDFSEIIVADSGLDPAEVVEIWKANPQDLQTLMSVDFQDIGVGYAVNSGMTYYVLDAGRAGGDSTIIGSPEGGAAEVPPATPLASRILTSTPLEDGAVYHVVQQNEALWGIALAYEISVDEIKKLNRLPSNDIYTGQKLLVLQPENRGTKTPEPTLTVTLGIPISMIEGSATPSASPTLTRIPRPPTTLENGTVIVFGIILVAAVAAGLGAWLGRQSSA